MRQSLEQRALRRRLGALWLLTFDLKVNILCAGSAVIARAHVSDEVAARSVLPSGYYLVPVMYSGFWPKALDIRRWACAPGL